MGAEQALKGPIVGGKAPERTGGWLAVRSRGGVRGYAIGLLALVLAAAVALALAPFVDAKSASLLLLGAVMVAADQTLLVSQLRAARDQAGLGTRASPGQTWPRSRARRRPLRSFKRRSRPSTGWG